MVKRLGRALGNSTFTDLMLASPVGPDAEVEVAEDEVLVDPDPLLELGNETLT